jgi:hypothetical protein
MYVLIGADITGLDSVALVVVMYVSSLMSVTARAISR